MQLLKVIAALLLGWGGGLLVNWLADVLPPEKKPRPLRRVWLVQAAAVAAGLWLLLAPPERFTHHLSLAPGFLLLLYLLLVVVIDFEHRLILHVTSLFGALLCAGVGAWLHGPLSTLAGGLAGLGGMLLVYYLGGLFVRLMSRLRHREIGEEAMGFGDVVLSGVMGLLLGFPGVFAGLIYTFILGGAGSLIYLLFVMISKRETRNLTLPYGPFIVLAMFLLVFVRG